MSIEDMIEAGTKAFKEKVIAFCQEAVDEPLSAASAAVVTQGIQQGLSAAGQAVLRTFLESKDDFPEVVVHRGEVFRFKYRSAKTFESLWSKMTVTRGVYQNAADTKSHVPLDAAWGMANERLTREVQEAVGFACSFVTPEETRQLLEKSAMFHPHPTQIKRCVEQMARRADAVRDDLNTRIRASESAPAATRVLAASMDGANVLLNEKGKKRGRPKERPKGAEDAEPRTAYKNAMVGSISFYGDVKDGHKGPQRLACRYTSHMPEDRAVTFKGKFEAELEAAEAQVSPDVAKVLVCDGARSIWNYVEHNERFDGYEKIIDYFHAVEHLSLAAEALFGKGTDEAQAWYDEYADKLLEQDDGAQRILHSMDYYAKTRALPKARRKELATQRTFFKRNKAKMTYADFRRRGLPIGSGPVEAACKTLVKTRLCRSGMRWSRQGGQRILDLRTYVKSNRWDAFWENYNQLKQAA